MAQDFVADNVKIPVLRPRLPQLSLISPYIERIDQNQIYSNRGPLVRELEFRYAVIFGVDPANVVAITNATLGITLAVQNHSPYVWRVPDFTFGATALAVLNAGKGLELVDVDENSWAMALPSGEINPNIGHIVVMPFGNNSTFQKWDKIPNVVFDAAASLGDPSWNLGKLTNSQTIVFSLHATKVFGGGEGGLIVCGDPANANLIRSSINFGFNSEREISMVGTNAKMSEYSAAVALAALDQRDLEVMEWESSQRFARALALGLDHQNPNLQACPVNPYFIVRFKDEEVLSDFERFSARINIETRKWWPRAIHQMTHWSREKDSGVEQNVSAQSVSVSLASTVLGLPMNRDLSGEEFERISFLLTRFQGSFQN
jgi:dTDP-4-amino-4,6-dideoxygalactose transaminase